MCSHCIPIFSPYGTISPLQVASLLWQPPDALTLLLRNAPSSALPTVQLPCFGEAAKWSKRGKVGDLSLYIYIFSLSWYIYIYIYIEREREICQNAGFNVSSWGIHNIHGILLRLVSICCWNLHVRVEFKGFRWRCSSQWQHLMGVEEMP